MPSRTSGSGWMTPQLVRTSPHRDIDPVGAKCRGRFPTSPRDEIILSNARLLLVPIVRTKHHANVANAHREAGPCAPECPLWPVLSHMAC